MPNFLDAEKILLQEVAAGNEESFKILFNRYNEKLFRYIYSITKSKEVTEELVTDVFLKIWLGRDLVTRIENLNNFLFRIAHNKSIDFLRAAATNPKFRDLLWDEIQAFSSDFADSRLIQSEYQQALREAIDLLSPQRKKVYQLSREENLSHDEIAQKLGLSRHTINNHIVEAQKFIRAYLSKQMDIAWILLLFPLAK